jgi:hypothetical protein
MEYNDGIKEIEECIVKYVVEYLKTGVFRNKKISAYMKAKQ